MVNSRAGARAAWSIESRKVSADLSKLFGERAISRLEFEEGEVAREAVMLAYKVVAKKRATKVGRFPDTTALSKAVRRTQLSSQPTDPLLLFLQASERRGVYRASRGSFVDRAATLLEYDGDSVLVASADGLEGFLLDYDLSAPHDERYELEHWDTRSAK
jgi:hypothetical protein